MLGCHVCKLHQLVPQKRILKYKINANLQAAYSTSEPMTLLLLWLLGYHSTQWAVALFKQDPQQYCCY